MADAAVHFHAAPCYVFDPVPGHRLFRVADQLSNVCYLKAVRAPECGTHVTIFDDSTYIPRVGDVVELVGAWPLCDRNRSTLWFAVVRAYDIEQRLMDIIRRETREEPLPLMWREWWLWAVRRVRNRIDQLRLNRYLRRRNRAVR